MISALLISGCALKEAPPMNTYTLEVENVSVIQHSKYRNKVLKVAYPQTLKEKVTDRMRFSYSSNDSGVYQNSQWSNALEKLIQGSVITMLQESRMFKAVLPYASTAGEDLRLESMIYDISHHIRGKASYAVLSIEFALIDTSTGRLIKTKRFSYKEETPTVDARGYAEATNQALQRLSRDLVMWLKEN